MKEDLKAKRPAISCSFCNKLQEEVKTMIAGNNVYICDECVLLSLEALKKKDIGGDSKSSKKIPSPLEVFDHLNKHVIGQERAKKVLSVAVTSHYKRLANPVVDDIELKKNNICLIGPTGSGKTLLAESLAKFLDVPLAIVDANPLSSAGYVGLDVENLVSRLLQVADYDKEKTEHGIIFIDEIDKKAKKGESASITRDVSGEDVQQALLKMLEGDTILVPPQGGRKHPNQEFIEINTKNILFIVGGAFVGLEKIINNRVNKKESSMGFGAKVEAQKDNIESSILAKVEPDDLVKFGLIPELVGRLSVLVSLDELSEEELIKVLREPNNAIIKQYQALFSLDKVKLEFTEDALHAVATLAKAKKTGARGLQGIIETTLIDTLFYLSKYASEGCKKIIIGKEVFLDKANPKIVK